MKHFFLITYLLFTSLIITAQKALVTKVIDGDTYVVKILDTQQEIKVRLWGIDAPELSQPYGVKAKEYCVNRYLNKEVTLKQKRKDQYKRVIAIITYDDEIINEHLISQGVAWDYQFYSKSEYYANLQIQAMNNKVGLWSNPKAIEPKIWRRKR